MSEHYKILAHLGYAYLDMYRKDIFQLQMIFDLPVVRQCLLSIYSSLVARKFILAIDKLPADIKEQLKGECRPYISGRTPELAVEFAKCYWVLDQLAQKEKEIRL